LFDFDGFKSEPILRMTIVHLDVQLILEGDEMDKNAHPVLLTLLVVMLCCCLGGFLALACGLVALPSWSGLHPETRIGFPFDGKIPAYPGGDEAAAGHIFIHQYPFPTDGYLTGVTWLADHEPNGPELREEVFILVLRPVPDGYQVIFRQELMVDDLRWDETGRQTVHFSQPLQVLRGDVLAHWQPTTQPGGPIPLNDDANAVEGRTIGKAGFQFEDTDPGRIIHTDGFSGGRDYFLNGLFEREK
jgi:hypothetical protein